MNKIIVKEREIQKTYHHSIKPQITWDSYQYNKKPNYTIEYRYYWELARTLAGGLLQYKKPAYQKRSHMSSRLCSILERAFVH